MVLFTTISLIFIDQLATIGLAFIFCGIFFILLPKWGYFKWCIEVRKSMIKESELIGDESKIEKLRNEICALKKRLPMQGYILVGLGTLFFIISIFIRKQ